MNEKRSLLKGFRVARPLLGAQIVDRRRNGLIVELEKSTAMGFQMVRVLWNDTTEIDTIAENYLHLIDEA